jgi:hypothetical protein
VVHDRVVKGEGGNEPPVKPFAGLLDVVTVVDLAYAILLWRAFEGTC